MSLQHATRTLYGETKMTLAEMISQRLYQQQLSHPQFTTPTEVVTWMGAMQGQDYAGVKWALGLRLPHLTDADIEKAFTEGSILRTHVMRPTWHLVPSADIRWMIQLTAPRVQAISAYMYRQLELDEATFKQSNATIVKALEGGKQLTRAELGKALAQVGIVAEGMRLGYLMYYAELEALICSGARRGKQFTYALLDERAPQAKTLPREEALATLVQRFFTSHGHATVKDFAWWSGLTVADTKAGIEMVKPALIQETIEGQTYWFSPALSAPQNTPLQAYLLPQYDEYGIGYRDHSGMIEPQHLEQIKKIIFTGVTVMGGQVLGTWKRTFSKGRVIIESAPFRPFTPAENEAFRAAVARFGEFLGMPVTLL